MRNLTRITIALMTSVLLSFSSSAKNWYVDDAANLNDIYTPLSVNGSDIATGTALAPLASLSKAISLAVAGDFIYVDAGTFSGTANRDMIINKALSIYGAGSNLTIFNGAAQVHYFLRITASNVDVQNIKVVAYALDQTDEANSISIYAGTSNITGINFENVWFDKCVGSGGDGSVRIGGSYGVSAKFDGCLATCNAGGSYGGAFFVQGDNHKVDLSNCYFESNEKASPGGAIYIEGTNSNVGSTIVTIAKSTFKNNVAISSGNGGAIWVEGATLNVLSSCFIDNKCTNSSGYGNAICGGKASKTNISNSSFVSNSGGKGHQVSISSSFSNMSGSPTGSINLNIDNCYFDGTSASSATGVYFKGTSCDISNSNFTSPTKIENGGGIFAIHDSGNPTKSGTINFINTAVSLTTANPPCIGAISGSCGAGISIPCANNIFHPVINAASETFALDPNCGYLVPSYTATDYCTPQSGITMTQNPAAGTILLPGTTTAVTITATNAMLNSKTIVVNLTAPVGSCATITSPPTTTKSVQYFCSVPSPGKKVSDISIVGIDIKWYDAPTGGSLIPSSAILASHKYYASQTIGGVESISRTEVDVYVLNAPILTITNPSTVCSPSTVDITSSSVVSTTGTKLSYWSDNIASISIANQSAIGVSGIYYIKSENEACSIIKQVSVTIDNPIAPTTSDVAQSFCASDKPLVQDLQTNSGSNIKWYKQDPGGTDLSQIAELENGSYYATQTTSSGCESKNRLKVTVTLTDPLAPSGSANQSFCATNFPKVSDLIAVGTNIKWYDLSGNALNSTTPLVDGSHYFSTQTTTVLPGCESVSRFEVVVSISTSAIVPTGNSQQTFCSSSNPKVSDLKTTSGSSILWYDAISGGTPLSPNTPLVDLKHYFATESGCESTTRLDVQALIKATPLAPTTIDASQSFCSMDNRKVSDLSATGSAIKWYDALGTEYPSNAALADGTYYATQTIGLCESIDRLSVTVKISNPIAPSINAIYNPNCLINTGSVDFSNLPLGKWTLVITPAIGSSINTSSTGQNFTLTGLKPSSIYKFIVKDSSNCSSDETGSISIGPLMKASDSPIGEYMQYFCSSSNPKISDLNANGINMNWYSSINGGSSLSSTDALTETHYYASQTKNGECESSSRLDVDVHLSNLYLTLDSKIKNHCGKSDGVIRVIAKDGIGDYEYSWVNQQSVTNILSNIGVGQFTANVKDSIGCKSSISIIESCESIIPQIISADGNGKNDSWVLNLDPSAKVDIYNRWGSLVFTASPYMNDWNGQTSDGITTLGKGFLPGGTYFYVIDKKDGERPSSGYIELIR